MIPGFCYLCRMQDTLTPFCDGESATEWLSRYTDGYGLDRKAMYCLHIINSLIQDGRYLYQRIPQDSLRGFGKGARRAVEASIYLRAESSANSRNKGSQPHVGRSEETRKSCQERLIREYAKRDKCWFGNAPDYLAKRFKKCGEGSEALVFDGGEFVYKFINNVFFADYAESLDRIALHNKFSPKIPLTVLGYGMNGEGEYGIVVKQPFVKGRYLSEESICAFIEQLGLKNVKDVIATTEYVNDFYYIGDMHDENAIITPGGEVAMFDTDCRLNTPDLGYGGKWIIPGLSYSECSVKAIDTMMRRIAPTVVSRHEYENRFSNDKNLLKEQLAQTGRYNGAVKVMDENGTPKRCCLQVDPDDDSRLLRIWCGGIGTMLGHNKEWSEEEKTALAAGRGVPRGNAFFAFDLNSGTVRPCTRFNQRIALKKAASLSLDDQANRGLHR